MAAVTLPAPLGGWNARDALENMDPGDAVTLTNWIPGSGVVVGRGGSLTKLSGLSGPVDTLIPYQGTGGDSLLAAYAGNIADVSSFSAPAVLQSGFTSNAWQFASFDDKLLLANGADAPQVYDGTALSPMVITLLATPVNAAFATATTGGTLGAGTYYYRVSATNSNGETLASSETSQATTGSTSTVTVNWEAVVGATGYNIYGRTTGAELLMASVDATSLSWLDDGSVTPVGTLPAANTTGPVAANLLGVVNFKGRAFFWEKASQSFWYAAAGSFQGALSRFPFAMFTQRGGYIVQIITWTRDSGDGVDDYCAFIFTTGETLVYQGDDPSNVLAWSMVGRFQLGAPLGVRAHCRFASTEIILTSDGFVTLDEAIQNARSEVINTFGGKIVRAAKNAAKVYGGNFGWEAIFYPAGNLLIANIPLANNQFAQYVQNTNTQGWCQFTGWNARCFGVYEDRLYFGTYDGSVVLADVSSLDDVTKPYSDDGQAIPYEALTAYQKFGEPGLKSQLTAARVITNVFDTRALSLNAFADYKVGNLPPVNDPVEQTQGQWDVSFWDEDYWASQDNDPASMAARPTLRPVSTFGFAIALDVRYHSVVQNVAWFSTTFLYNQGGVN